MTNTSFPPSVDLAAVRDWLASGSRVALYIRHAERPPLQADDPTFGESLGLTEAGERQARAFGAALHGAVADVRLFASPMTRTRRTVQLIAEGMGLGGERPVEDAPEIGVDNVFTDQVGAHRAMQEVGVIPYQIAYFEAGHAPAARPIAEATARAVGWMRRAATAPLTLFGSHDVTIAVALTGLCLARITAETWVPFLTGLAMVERDGVWHYHRFRMPDENQV